MIELAKLGVTYYYYIESLLIPISGSNAHEEVSGNALVSGPKSCNRLSFSTAVSLQITTPGFADVLFPLGSPRPMRPLRLADAAIIALPPIKGALFLGAVLSSPTPRAAVVPAAQAALALNRTLEGLEAPVAVVEAAPELDLLLGALALPLEEEALVLLAVDAASSFRASIRCGGPISGYSANSTDSSDRAFDTATGTFSSTTLDSPHVTEAVAEDAVAGCCIEHTSLPAPHESLVGLRVCIIILATLS